MKIWTEIPDIDLFSDGGAEPNPGKGGFGVILSYKGKRKEFFKGYEMTTNNRMELMGVIYGLEQLKTKSNVQVYTDSKYVVSGITKGWAKRWKQNNWKREKDKKALNSDLWERLLDLTNEHNVNFNWVKGHSGHPENERCDYLATNALNSYNLLVDSGYSEKSDLDYSDQKVNNANKKKLRRKIIKEGDRCRHCNTPVKKKIPNKLKLKPNQSYYFEYYMFCPNCKAMFMVEEAKRLI